MVCAMCMATGDVQYYNIIPLFPSPHSWAVGGRKAHSDGHRSKDSKPLRRPILVCGICQDKPEPAGARRDCEKRTPLLDRPMDAVTGIGPYRHGAALDRKRGTETYRLALLTFRLMMNIKW